VCVCVCAFNYTYTEKSNPDRFFNEQLMICKYHPTLISFCRIRKDIDLVIPVAWHDVGIEPPTAGFDKMNYPRQIRVLKMGQLADASVT